MKDLETSIRDKYQKQFGHSVDEAGYTILRTEGYPYIAILGSDEALDAWEKAQDLREKLNIFQILFWIVFGVSFIVGLCCEVHYFRMIVAAHALCYSIVWMLLCYIFFWRVSKLYHSRINPLENVYKGEILFYNGRTFTEDETFAEQEKQ